MKICEALRKAIKELKENNIEEPINSARRILAYTLDVTKEYLIINNEKELSDKQEKRYNANIHKIILGEPIQYIIGKQEFMGIEFIVDSNVLIPQPDTEILVEKVIELIKSKGKTKVLDLCTGSGAIAVSITKYVPEAEVVATDISAEALKVAKQNDRENKIELIKSDLFENIHEKFDIIVSNPPYIKTEEIKHLSKQVQNEPLLALNGGQDGLYFYRKIIKEAHNFLNKNGYLCLEIGEDQKAQVVEIIQDSNYYSNIKTYKDLANNDRVVIGLYKN